MELAEIIKNRRSIRKYKNDDVSNELIMELLESARLCQSAKNRQPWSFGILRKEKKDDIADIMINWCDIAVDEKEGKKNSVRHTANIMKEAPVLILVFQEKNQEWLTSDILSVGASIEHICLRATDLGLGALWICNTASVKQEISDYVNKSNLELLSVVSIGYPDENPAPRPRKDLEELILFNDK